MFKDETSLNTDVNDVKVSLKSAKAQHGALIPKASKPLLRSMNQYEPFLWLNVYVFFLMQDGCAVNVFEQNRAKTANILALVIYLEKAKFGRLQEFYRQLFGSCSDRRRLLWFCSAQTHSYKSYLRKH